jgi:uncharacterized protein YjbI with pentapeptide repeats
MALFEIKHRFSGSVLFSLETESLKLCVEAAVKGGANLRGADLGGANLGGADLHGANLGGANLRGADLGGANLGGADLHGANLGGADLGGANLGGADLHGANLRDADLRDADLGGNKLVGDRPVIQISPIGSRSDFLTAYITDNGVFLRAGCFFGTVGHFKAALQETHGSNAHAEEYLAALALIETHAKIYTSKAEGK